MNFTSDSLPTGHSGIDARLGKGPTIHPTAWVVPGATVIGDVTLEEESSVWYGAVLRGDINRIVLGPRSNIQDNAVVHLDTGFPTILGELVTISHGAIVHACTGARSIIGANALVTLDMKIPPGVTRARFARENPASIDSGRTKGPRAMGVELRRNRQAFPQILRIKTIVALYERRIIRATVRDRRYNFFANSLARSRNNFPARLILSCSLISRSARA